MTIAHVASTGISTTSASRGTTSSTVAYVGVAAGRMAVITAQCRPNTPNPTLSPSTGWTQTVNAGGGAAGTTSDTGPTKIFQWCKVLDGTETGSVTINTSGGTLTQGVMSTYSKTAAAWGVPFGVTANDSSQGTNVSGVSGATTAPIPTGALLVVGASSNTDDTQATSAFVTTQTSATIGTRTARNRQGASDGLQGTVQSWDAPVTAGGSTGAVTMGFTWAASSSGPLGLTVLTEGAAISSLTEDATSGTIDTVKWSQNYGTISQTGGRMRLSSDAPNYNAFVSAGAYIYDKVYRQAFPAALNGGSGSVYDGMWFGPSETNRVGMYYDAVANQLVCQVTTNGTAANTTFAYNSTTQAWHQMVSNGTVTDFQVSANGTSWSTIFSSATPPVARFTTLGYLKIEAHRDTGTTNFAESDNLNLAPTTTSVVTSTLDARWRVLSSISTTVDARWAVYTGITGTTDLRWAVLSSTSSTVDLRWAVLSGVSSTVDARWTVLSSIASTLDARWAVFSSVSSTLDARWAVSGATTTASSTLDARWRVLSSVSSTVDSRWAVYSSVGTPLDSRWVVYGAVATTLDARWAVGGSVSSTLDARWSVLSSVSSTVDARWTVRSSVSATVDARWISYAQAANTLDARWRVSTQVSSTLDSRWAVYATTAGTVDARWAVLSGISAALDARWRVSNSIANTLDARWSVLASVSSGLDARWIVYGLAAAALDARWISYALASASLDARWNVDGTNISVSSSLDARWRVAGVVSSDLDARWRVSAFIANSLDARWVVRNGVSGSLDARWAVLGPVSATLDARWALRASVLASLDLRWRQSQLASNTLDARWTSAGQVASSISAQWRVFGVVSGTLDGRWAVRSQISTLLDARWIVSQRVLAPLQLLWISAAAPLPDQPVPSDARARLTDRITVNVDQDNIVYDPAPRIVANLVEVLHS